MSAGLDSVPTLNLNPEAQARADWYAFLARIWYAPPDEALLRAMADAPLSGESATAPLDRAWAQLARAAAGATVQSAKLEYDLVFIGTGKAEVTPYMAHWLPGTTGKDRHLLRLRNLLDEWGLARAESAHEPEDHLAAVCEVMRHLILAGGAEENSIARQAELFNAYLAPGYRRFVAAARGSQQSNFYKSVALFTETFFGIEEQSFQML